MLIMFNPHVKKSAHFAPPVPITFSKTDRTASQADQVTSLLWIPAFLVGRFLYQFPALGPESEELFSEGVLAVAEVVANEQVGQDDIERKVMMFCTHRMQQYARGLYQPMSISGDTQYAKRRTGRRVPKLVTGAESSYTTDDHTSLLLRDALDAYGIDLETATAKQRRKLGRLFS
jgi:hypothetical protein